ncbi:hypothetical protein FJ434_16485 [Mesorhizobium sp. B2-5-13]|uniref:hypothetical protein n=1 Tax=unclassified Mesorhizobium TaxID=325217 RepID=UPI00112DF1C0|nr:MULTISPECIES: hypothetical protein [unclassified Mesorhizobium]TPJ85522.1 hypothetical protein FJ434_16485 [Mesorhizobium sp. B2-5-13]TPK39266.1 hypothetical protein FJ560_29375 [Mesorhizobium sp. B2-5-5]
MRHPLEPICDGKAALEYTTSMEPGPEGKPIMWLCRADGERLEKIAGRQQAEDRATALIEKGNLP